MELFCRIFSSGSILEKHLPPIIFLHGLVVSSNVFKNVAPEISIKTKRKVYIPDIRNHGKSPWTKEMSYDVLTNDLLELMQRYEIQKAVLVGNSMGGRIAMNFALKYPDKVDVLIIEDMTPRNITSSGINFTQGVRHFVNNILLSQPPEKSLNEVKQEIAYAIFEFVSPKFCDKEKVYQYFEPDYVPIVKDGDSFRMEHNVDAVEKMLDENALVQNLPDQKLTFNGDVLFIYGSKGFFNLGKDSSIKKIFPRAVIKKIEGASHFVHYDSPDVYANIVSDFILNRNLAQSKY